MKKRLFTLMLAVMLSICAASSAYAYNPADDGLIQTYSDKYLVILIDKEYMNADRKLNATVKLEVRDVTGRKNTANLHIELYDIRGKWICEWDTSSKDKLKLGNDHAVYVMRVTPYQKGGDNPSVSDKSENFINGGKAPYWKIVDPDHCVVMDYLYGDINKDGKISISDYSRLKLYTIGKASIPDLNVVDLNRDGRVSITDLSIMNAILVGERNAAYAFHN